MTDTLPHLSADVLLQAIDGELSTREAADVSAHLEACWSCRAERDRIAALIGEIVDFRDHAFTGRSTSAVRRQFSARLRERLDTEFNSDRADRSRWWHGVRRSVFATWNGRIAVAAATLLLLWVSGATPSAAIGVVRDVVRWLGSSRAQAPASPPAAVGARAPAPTTVPPRMAIGARPTVERSVSPVVAPRVINPVDLELEALWQLHRVGALVGEDVAIDRTRSNVSVRVRVEDNQRKSVVQQALMPLSASGVRVRVETFAEVATSIEPAAATPRVMYQELDANLQQPATSHEVSARVLKTARELTLHAFALDRLRQRLPVDVLNQASEPARVTYRVLLREHLDAVETRWRTLSDELQSALGQRFAEPENVSDTTTDSVAVAALHLEDEVRASFGIQTGSERAAPPNAARFQALLAGVRGAMSRIR